MGLGNLFKKLFGSNAGSSTANSAEPVEYNGFQIVAEPMQEGGQYRTAGRICKEIDGETREVQFIRADNNSDLNSAIEHCVYKGKQIVDERGDAMFEREIV